VDAARALTGTSWVVTSIDQAPLAVDDPPTIDFDEDGHVGGGSGLNRFSGAWTMDEGVLVLGPLATTRMAGPPERMDLERRFLGVLAARCTVLVDDDELQLTSDGSTLRAVPAPAETADP
jgi:heat shock protein HslJ